MLGLHKKLAAATIPADKELYQRQIEATDRQIDALVYVIGGKMPPQGFYDRLSKHVLPEQATLHPTADRQPSVPETVFDPPDTDTRIRTWQYDAGSGVAAVDVSPDGETVVAGALGKRVLCLDSKGHQRWQAEVGNKLT